LPILRVCSRVTRDTGVKVKYRANVAKTATTRARSGGRPTGSGARSSANRTAAARSTGAGRSSGGRGQSHAGSRGSARSASGRRPTGGEPRSGRTRSAPHSRPHARSGPPLPWRMARGAWMGMATMTGGAVRSMGSNAEDPQAAHRRDGLGFLLLALSVVVAIREWWNLQGALGTVIHAVVAGTLGRVGLALPIVLFLFAIRMLRAPQAAAANRRMAVGTVALGLAASGLTHVALGAPD